VSNGFTVTVYNLLTWDVVWWRASLRGRAIASVCPAAGAPHGDAGWRWPDAIDLTDTLSHGAVAVPNRRSGVVVWHPCLTQLAYLIPTTRICPHCTYGGLCSGLFYRMGPVGPPRE